jgi:hypothetical protein
VALKLLAVIHEQGPWAFDTGLWVETGLGTGRCVVCCVVLCCVVLCCVVAPLHCFHQQPSELTLSHQICGTNLLDIIFIAAIMH